MSGSQPKQSEQSEVDRDVPKPHRSWPLRLFLTDTWCEQIIMVPTNVADDTELGVLGNPSPYWAGWVDEIENPRV